MVIEYSKFEEFCKKDSLDNIIYQFRYLVNYFYKNMKQTEITVVDCDNSNVDMDIVNSFRGFQLSFDDSFRERNNFIVFIDPSKDYFEEYDSFCNKNLPQNAVPSHICVLSSDVSVIEDCYGTLISRLENKPILVNITRSFNPSESINSSIISHYGEDNVFKVCHYCDTLYSYLKYPSVDFIREFNRCVDEILSEAGNKVIIYGGDYSLGSKSVYHLIVSEIYLRTGSCNFHVDKEDSESVAVKIASHLFRPYMMMVEDVVRFVNKFPEITAEFKESFVLYNCISNPRLRIKTSFIPLNNVENSEQRYEVFDSRQLNIIPLSVYYNIEDEDLKVACSEEKRLREFIHNLYDYLDIGEDGIIDITNLFFFELDGIEYVGYNHGYEFSSNSRSILFGLPAASKKITFEDLGSLLFVDCFKDFSVLCIFLNKMKVVQGRDLGKSIPIKTFRKNSVAFSSYYISNKSDDFTGIPNALFCTGMYSKDCYTTRVSLNKLLAEKVGIKKARKLLDSFGAFNVITNRFLELDL